MQRKLWRTMTMQLQQQNKFFEFLDWLKKKEWQDSAFVCSLLFFSCFYLFLFFSFHQFPSEYYGGDQYAHFGSALKIYDTMNPFLSSHYYGELQHYPWLVPFVIAMLSHIIFQNPFKVGIYFPIFILLGTMLITYAFGKRYFENKTWALILTISWAVELVPSFHPSDIAKQLMIPLLCLFALFLYDPKGVVLTKKRAFVAGIIYGIAGLEHVVTFFIASVLFLSALLLQSMEHKFLFWKQSGKKYLAVALMGWTIAAFFWVPLLVKYHGETLNDWQEYTSSTIIPEANIVSAMFQESMAYGTGFISIIAFIFMFVGIFFTIKKRDRRIFIPLLMIAAGLLGIIHPYVTYPLLGMTLGYYRFPIVFVFTKQLLLVLGLYSSWQFGIVPFLKARIEKREEKGIEKGLEKGQQKKKWEAVAAGVIFLIWVGSSFYFLMSDYTASERYEYAVAEDEKIEGYRAMRAFIQDKHLIMENEVTLTLHPDVGFFFNAMTGKNVMLSRITHATPFVDHNQRAADMAVVLYGNNSAKAKEIINEYHLAYFFSEVENVQFKYTCLDRWNETVNGTKRDKTTAAYWCLQTDPKYRSYLSQYGIETATASVRLAAGDKDVPLTKVLVIKPKEVKINVQQLYEYKGSNGATILELYRIVGPSS